MLHYSLTGSLLQLQAGLVPHCAADPLPCRLLNLLAHPLFDPAVLQVLITLILSLCCSSKRGLDLGLSRGFSGSQAAKHLMGLAAANFAGGPGRRRRDTHAQTTPRQPTVHPSHYSLHCSTFQLDVFSIYIIVFMSLKYFLV